MSPRPRSNPKSSKHKARGVSTRNRSSDHDVLHLDSPLTDPDLGSPRAHPHLDYSAIATTNSLGGVQQNLAWFRPFTKSSAPPSPPHNPTAPNDPGASALTAPMESTNPIRATRLGKGRARKEDKQGDLVWPEHIEAALIEGLRLYHCTSSEDLHPSHTRNFGRNIKVSQFIKQKTGVYRSTRQISSRIQVLRSLWRDTDHFVLVAQPQELRRMGFRIGVRRPTRRAGLGPSHIPTSTVHRRTRQGDGPAEIEGSPILVPEQISFAPTSQFDCAPSSSYAHPISVPSCDQPMVEVDEDVDIDELLLSLTGHESPDVRNDSSSGLNLQLPLSMSLEMQPPPPSTMSTAFPSPVLPPGLPGLQSTPMPAHEPVLSLPSPPSLDALAEHFFDGSVHPTCTRTRTPTVPSAPSLLGSGYETAEGSPDIGVDLGLEPYLHPGNVFDSTTLFDWTALTGEQRSESFELVEPPSICAVNGGGGDHVDVHAWWTDFARLAPLFDAPQPDPQEQEQEQPLMVGLSHATSPQVQIEPLGEHLQIVAEEIQVQVTGQAPEIPLDPVQSESILRVNPEPLAPKQNPEPSHSLSPPGALQDLGPVASQQLSSLSLPFQHPSHQHSSKKCPCPFCVSMPIKKRQRKRKAVLIDEDSVHAVDGDGDGDAKGAWKRSGKERKVESADAKPHPTKRMKEPSRKQKGVRPEETTEPIREKMFVTTDENGKLKMLPLRIRATQHDEEVGLSANANPRPSQAQAPPPKADVPSPPPRPPQAKPMVPRRILPHPDTHPLISVPEHEETPETVLAHHSSLPARAPAPTPAPAPVPGPGSIVAPLPRYATSYNPFERWDVAFMEMESESEAQLLSALPPPIRRHQAQDVGRGGATRIQVQYQQQAMPVYSEYSFVRDSMYVSVPAQLHQYHQPKPAPTPLSYTHVEIPQSRYCHVGAQQQTQALQGSLMYAVPPMELYRHRHDPYQGHLHPAPYMHHPEATNCAQMPIEPLYPSHHAHDPYISGYHHPYV